MPIGIVSKLLQGFLREFIPGVSLPSFLIRVPHALFPEFPFEIPSEITGVPAGIHPGFSSGLLQNDPFRDSRNRHTL